MGPLTDPRRFTGLIIRKDGMFLVGTILYSKELRWSRSPYDAWRTRKREDAQKVAGKVGGQVMLFNPVVGQMRRF